MIKVLFSCILAAVFAAPAYADGAYLGLGVTTSSHDSYESGTKGAYKIFGGYDFTPTWGIEAGYMNIPTFNTDRAFATISREGMTLLYSGEANGKAMYIAGKATMAISDRIALVTKLGFGHERVNKSYVGPSDAFRYKMITNDLYAGIGLKYSLSKKVSLGLELERIGSGSQSGSGIRPEKASINVSYSF
ncbi:MAG: porin family protein [Pseudomonadota bacterium]